jgi:hypothetical protein
MRQRRVGFHRRMGDVGAEVGLVETAHGERAARRDVAALRDNRRLELCLLEVGIDRPVVERGWRGLELGMELSERVVCNVGKLVQDGHQVGLLYKHDAVDLPKGRGVDML